MKILLLGDSIRLGYCEFVRELLAGKAEVVYPAENGRFLQYTLRELQEWKGQLELSGDDIDIVHWNNGLWDVGHLGNGSSGEASSETATLSDGGYEYEQENLTPPDIYGYMLGRVFRRIRHLFPRAKVVFAYSTPALEGQCPPTLYRSNAEIRAYNEIARNVLEPGAGVLVNDLYAFADQELRELHRDWVHFSDEGSRRLAEQIVKFLRENAGI